MAEVEKKDKWSYAPYFGVTMVLSTILCILLGRPGLEAIGSGILSGLIFGTLAYFIHKYIENNKELNRLREKEKKEEQAKKD